MTKQVRSFVVVFFSLVLVVSLVLGGCTKYANEKQITKLDESEAAALAAEKKTADLEKEKADLQAKLAEKQAELQKVQAEKESIKAKLGN
jgi:uncharacterized protein YlxW (UPF0749 family)